MKHGVKYKITQPEEFFTDQYGEDDSFPEIIRYVEVLVPYVVTPSGNCVIVKCLQYGRVYPISIEDNYLVEEIS